MKVNNNYCLIIKIKGTIFTSNIQISLLPKSEKVLNQIWPGGYFEFIAIDYQYNSQNIK